MTKDQTRLRSIMSNCIKVLLSGLLPLSSLGYHSLVHAQIRNQVEYDKGRCLGVITIAQKRISDRVTQDDHYFMSLHEVRALKLENQVVSCARSTGRDTEATRFNCVQRLSAGDSSFYLGYMKIAPYVNAPTVPQIIGMKQLYCRGFF